MFETYEECVAYLNANRDGKYDDFNSKIVNSTYPTLGVDRKSTRLNSSHMA